MASLKDTVEAILSDGVRRIAPGATVAVALERPRHPEHGDYATSVALQLAKSVGRKPRDIAEDIVRATREEIERSGSCEPLQIAGAGFINIRLKQTSKTLVVRQILESGAAFGHNKTGEPQRIQVEFVSANPTGPLHVGHGRQAALGDALAALLEARGHEVTREFYYNDAGAQIQNLALSVLARARGIEPGGAGWPAD